MSEAYKNAQVVTSDGKDLGTVKSSDSNSLIVFKKGVLRDEEFHVPIIAVSHYNRGSGNDSDNNSTSILILNLSEKEVKHGFEFAGDSKPNSDLVSGKSDSGYKIGLKETIRYEAFMPDAEKNINPASSTDKLPCKQEYICDMCMRKFHDSSKLQDHRKDVHSAATGI
ncbi:MAG TPA: hypothetical protein VFS97_08850 [Nitrososphaeraceae archaeon]|nr:hypothetical protein [Nitrososphaeraceae archaeon]